MVRLDIQRWSSSFTPLGPTVCPSTSSPLYLNIWTSPPSSVWVCVFVCEPCVCMLWKVLLGYRQGESADINTEKGPRQVHPHQHERWSSAHSPVWILVSATGCSMTHTHKNMAHGSEGYNIHGSTCDPHLQLSHVSIVLVWTTLCCIKAKKEIMPCPFQHRQQSASPTDKEASLSEAASWPWLLSGRWAGRRMGDATVQAEQSQPRASTGQRYCIAHILYLTSPITCCTTCLPWCVGGKNDAVKTKVVPSFCRLLRNRAVNELYKKNKKNNKVVRDTSDLFEFDVKQRLMVSCYSQGREESNTQSVWAQKIYIIKWWEMMK